jgi:hypothetical protein
MNKIQKEEILEICEEITTLQYKVEEIRNREKQKANNIGYSKAGETGAGAIFDNNVEALKEAYTALNTAYHALGTTL